MPTTGPSVSNDPKPPKRSPRNQAGVSGLIGADQILVAFTNRSSVGDQWLDGAVSTAWRIWLHYSGARDEDPLEALSRKWELPEPRGVGDDHEVM
jgi:hypothetical protein